MSIPSLGFIGPIGFIGLGVMGSAMCANMARKHGGPVHVFDMVPAAIAALAEVGAIAADSVAAVGQAADIVFLSLPGGSQVAAVCDELAEHLKPGAAVVDLSTTSVAEAREIAGKLSAGGIAFADAPVARTREAASAGTLSIMVGASEELFARIAPLLAQMGSDVTHCGAVGCGQVVKLVNNALLFEQVVAIAEMMVVAGRAGVTPEKLIEAVGLGSGNSFALQNHAVKAMAPRQFPEKSFPPEYALKDLGYAIDLARDMGVDPQVALLAERYYRAAVEQGHGGRYFPVVIELIDKGIAP